MNPHTRNHGARRVKRGLLALLALAALLGTAAPADALVLDDENRLTISLSDGTRVDLIGAAAGKNGRKSRNYYYLPSQVRLATKPNTEDTPEFLFLKFTTEEREDQGGVQGALLHFLVEWGLTEEQEDELKAKLKADHNGTLKGAVPMNEGGDNGGYRIISATLSDGDMTRALVDSGRAPLTASARAAGAARLDQHGAQLLAATFEETTSIADLSVAFDFDYTVQTPAAKGTITFDWSKYESEYDSYEAEYKKWQSGRRVKTILGWEVSSKPTYSYSYDEMRSHYDFLSERQVVKMEFEEFVADEKVSAIRDAFFQYFLDSFAEPAPDVPPPPPGDEEQEENPNIRYGNSYRYSQTFSSRSFQRKKQTFDLNYRMAISKPHQVVGNLAEWYDFAKDNPQCVGSVNLNDPFFQHRDIHFILDLEAKEIFDDVVNYVTVEVQKKRSEGNDFEDHVTIDQRYIAEQGIDAAVTYARGEDANPDSYRYRAQWSLKGGNLWPKNPGWETGSWEGVTLAPPLKRWVIEVEGDLGEMEESDITRVTAQIRYRQFGEEVEQNIHLSPVKGEPLVEQPIFVDRDARGYAARLIVNHKTEGKLALDWQPQVGDNYVYATIPPELLEDDDIKAVAKEAAKDLIDGAKDSVLDRFEDVLGGA
jgi:hypothetical protein